MGFYLPHFLVNLSGGFIMHKNEGIKYHGGGSGGLAEPILEPTTKVDCFGASKQ